MNTGEIQEALSHVPASDRDTWVSMAMAIKSALGDEGFSIWDDWSQTDSSYRPRDARSVWKSIKRSGGITINTLFKYARDYGWKGEGRVVDMADRRALREQERREAAETARRHREAAAKAMRMLQAAEITGHPYLWDKGFLKEQGFVLNGELLIPMRDQRTNEITSLQRIDKDGNKLFLHGGRAKGAVFAMGAGPETFFVEGYCTGLSVRLALQRLYRQARVVVCFSAANLAYVASQGRGDQYVIADHDANGVGQRYAEKTHLPWWMPPEPGDANDHHQSAGLSALAAAINELRLEGKEKTGPKAR